MATVEGKGLVPPKMVPVQIDGSELHYLQHVADQRDKHRNYKGSSSLWRRGSTANPILMGLVGEYAFQEYLRTRGIKVAVVDDRLNNGDGGKDAVIAGVSYQIKTSGKSYQTCFAIFADGATVTRLSNSANYARARPEAVGLTTKLPTYISTRWQI